MCPGKGKCFSTAQASILSDGHIQILIHKEWDIKMKVEKEKWMRNYKKKRKTVTI